MKKDNLFLGIFLIAFGAIWLLNSLGFLHLQSFGYYISRALNLWPIFIIIFGVSLITNNRNILNVTYVISAIVLVVYVFYETIARNFII